MKYIKIITVIIIWFSILISVSALSPSTQITTEQYKMELWKVLNNHKAGSISVLLNNIPSNLTIYCIDFKKKLTITLPSQIINIQPETLSSWVASVNKTLFKPTIQSERIIELYNTILHFLAENLIQHANNSISFIIIEHGQDKKGDFINFSTIDNGNGFMLTILINLGYKGLTSGKGNGQGFPIIMEYSDELTIHSNGYIWHQQVDGDVILHTSEEKSSGCYISAKTWLDNHSLKKNIKRIFNNFLISHNIAHTLPNRIIENAV